MKLHEDCVFWHRKLQGKSPRTSEALPRVFRRNFVKRKPINKCDALRRLKQLNACRKRAFQNPFQNSARSLNFGRGFRRNRENGCFFDRTMVACTCVFYVLWLLAARSFGIFCGEEFFGGVINLSRRKRRGITPSARIKNRKLRPAYFCSQVRYANFLIDCISSLRYGNA